MMSDKDGVSPPCTRDKIEQTRTGSKSIDQMKSGSKDNEDQRSQSVSTRKEGGADGTHIGKVCAERRRQWKIA